MINKKHFATLTLTTLLLSACQATGTTANEVVTISTTRCFGSCPVYSVTVNPDGRLDFEGKRDVAKLGGVQRTIATEKAQQVLQNLHAYRPVTGTTQNNAECSRRATDHPSYVLTWSQGQQSTIYNHYLGCHSAENRAIAKGIKSAIQSLNINHLIKAPLTLRRKE